MRAVFGASGAAKWLTIYGLDRAIFGDWLAAVNHPVHLFGTSVGAFKLAAAAMADPAAALERLARAYIEQSYEHDFSPQAVDRETGKILRTLLPQGAQQEILDNPRFRFHCAAVWSRGWLGRHNIHAQRLALGKAFLLSLRGRPALRAMLGRTIFGVGGTGSDGIEFSGRDGFETQTVALTADNLERALTASGSIPVLMRGVDDIEGDRIYRDGGLLDYHPVPSNVMAPGAGIVLYPHFYPAITEAWFDKFFRWRRVAVERLDNVLLIAPSDDYIRSLPRSRIPDRQDFYRYKGREQERLEHWYEVMHRSLELGEAWLSLIRSGDLAGHIRSL